MWPSHALMSFLGEIQIVEDEGPVIAISSEVDNPD